MLSFSIMASASEPTTADLLRVLNDNKDRLVSLNNYGNKLTEVQIGKNEINQNIYVLTNLKCDSSGNCSGGAQLEITDTGSFYHGTKKSIYSIRLSLLESKK